MTTRLDKTLKRELMLQGRAFILAVSPDGLKLTLKGRRKGQELRWSDLISGDAALAAALNASLGSFAGDDVPAAERERAVRSSARPPRKSPAPARATARHPRRTRTR
jgi:hypothetical protein